MNNKNTLILLTIPGQASGTDKGALLCDGIMLAILMWNQIRYGLDMLFLIIPLLLIGILIILFGIVPEKYCFTEDSLQITHAFRRKIEIPYDAVFNFEASARDGFLNVTRRNTVKVYHMIGKRKRLAVCNPCDTETFVDALKTNCREFHTDMQKSRLQVFFTDHTEKEDVEKS